MWRRKPRPELNELIELLTGIGRLMQQMDSRLETIVSLMEDEEDGPEDQS